MYIECKNYTKDIKNPELDQLTSRFSNKRGKFGILTCRKMKNRDYIYKKCADAYGDDRGLMIPLDDSDIINMLNYIRKHDTTSVQEYMSDIQRKIIMQS